jgi:hypothetical protein
MSLEKLFKSVLREGGDIDDYPFAIDTCGNFNDKNAVNDLIASGKLEKIAKDNAGTSGSWIAHCIEKNLDMIKTNPRKSRKLRLYINDLLEKYSNEFKFKVGDEF